MDAYGLGGGAAVVVVVKGTARSIVVGEGGRECR